MKTESTRDAYDTIIIGGGKAGKTLAAHLGNRGIKTALIERDANMIGGACINIACVPTKSFVQSARVAHLARNAASYGIELGDCRIDWLAIRRRVEGITASMREMNRRLLASAPALDLIIATARFQDAHTVVIEDERGNPRRLTADKIFINTGTRPAELKIPGMTEVNALDSRSVQQIDDLPGHLMIIGGGYVALEFAQMFRRFGSNVTLIVRAGRILPKEDDDIAQEVTTLLRNEGIQIVTAASPVRAARSGTTVSLAVMTGGVERIISGSHLLAAIGRVANTESLNLSAAGVELSPRGFIQVNARLETTAAKVWAVGDCNGGPQFTHASLDDYRIVRANVFDDGSRSTTDRLIPSTVFIEPELARIGLTEAEARERGFAIRVAKIPVSNVTRARTSGHTTGVLKAVVDSSTGRILGCALLSADAGEMIGTVQMAMLAGMPFTRLRDAVLCHPTMTEGFNYLFADTCFQS